MDKLPKDIVALLAIDLDYVDILKLCRSSSRMNRFICQNEDFWRNKLYKTYPFARKLQEKFPITNFRKFYGDVEREIKNIIIKPQTTERMSPLSVPLFISPELINFFMFSDFGVITDTEIPLNYILWLTLQKGVMSRDLATVLTTMHLNKYIFRENGKKFIKSSPEMDLYLGKYFDALNISKNKFVYSNLPRILNLGFLPSRDLTGSQMTSTVAINRNIYEKIREIKKAMYENE